MKYQEKYKDSLEYIDKYWNKIIFKPSRMRLLHTFLPEKNPNFIYIPNSFFVPNDKKFKNIFYWDSYFMFRGLMGTKRQKLMKKMVDNFTYLFDKYHIIPNFNHHASINRSQPPFMSSMVLDAYLSPMEKYSKFKTTIYKLKNKSWLQKAINTAQDEYETVWIDKRNIYNHSVPGYTLSRYGDRDIGYAHSSELESGWDMTSRFYNRCDHFLPIDLNVYLYKYEMDFVKASKLLGKIEDAKKWSDTASKRKKEINKYMWNKKAGFFFDYGYSYKQISNFLSLAAYTPLWAGLATTYQAKKMVKMLPKFETAYGLTITTKESLAKSIDLSKIQRRYHPSINDIIKPKQWDYPNIWSPLEYLTVIGLLKYGFITDATRIMKNSLAAHDELFKKHHAFFEKINGQTGNPGTGALYNDQKGFGWTNAVFYRYVQILSQIENNKPLYKNPQSKPPYDLTFLH